jgi:hypothetical protein
MVVVHNKQTRKHLLSYFLLLFFSGSEFGATCQNSSFQNIGIEKFLSRVEDQINAQAPDTSYHFILQMVWEHCGHDIACLIKTYESVVLRLERAFHLLSVTPDFIPG